MSALPPGSPPARPPRAGCLAVGLALVTSWTVIFLLANLLVLGPLLGGGLAGLFCRSRRDGLRLGCAGGLLPALVWSAALGAILSLVGPLLDQLPWLASSLLRHAYRDFSLPLFLVVVTLYVASTVVFAGLGGYLGALVREKLSSSRRDAGGAA